MIDLSRTLASHASVPPGKELLGTVGKRPLISRLFSPFLLFFRVIPPDTTLPPFDSFGKKMPLPRKSEGVSRIPLFPYSDFCFFPAFAD